MRATDSTYAAASRACKRPVLDPWRGACGGVPASNAQDPADILLVVEVADASLEYDLGTKVPLYQRHRIPEIWIIDYAGRQVHVFGRLPDGYAPARFAKVSEHLTACGVAIEVESLFP